MRTPGQRLKWAVFTVGGFSLRQCDALVGLTPGHLQAITTGTIKEPRASTLAKYAALAGLTLEWVLTGHGDEPAPDAIRQSLAAAKPPKGRNARKPLAHGPSTTRAGAPMGAKQSIAS